MVADEWITAASSVLYATSRESRHDSQLPAPSEGKCGGKARVVPGMKEHQQLLRRAGFVVLGGAAVFILIVYVLSPIEWVWLGPPEVAEPPDADPPEIGDIQDPARVGNPMPDGFRQLVARDVIEPVYHPVHVAADEVDWDDDTLVLGIAIDDEARAYPIRSLNRREIVNDRIADTPLLASW